MVQHGYLVTPWLIGLCDVQCLLAITRPVTWALTFPATDWWTLYCTCVTLCTVYNMMPCLKPWRFFHSGKLQAASLTTVCQCDSAFMLCWPLWPLAAVIQCFHALMKDSMLQKLPPPKPLPVPYLTALVERNLFASLALSVSSPWCVQFSLSLGGTSHLPSHNLLLPLDVEQPTNVVCVGLNLLHPRCYPSLLVAVGGRGQTD